MPDTEPDEAPLDSILNTTKVYLGLPKDYTPFDAELIIHINGALSILHQLGVGQEKPTVIVDASAKWSDFIGDVEGIESVKAYVGARVKLAFDPPQSGFGSEHMKKMIEEFEWRLNVEAEEFKNAK